MPSNNSSLKLMRVVVMLDVWYEMCGVEVSATQITPWFHVLTEKLTNGDEMFDALNENP